MTVLRTEEGPPPQYLATLIGKPLKISEAGTVQFPMVNHAVEIGWTAVTDKDAQAMRGAWLARSSAACSKASLRSSIRG